MSRPQLLIERLEARRLLDGTPDVPGEEQINYIDIEHSPISIYSHDGHIESVFSSFKGALPAGDYAASIDWGDGTLGFGLIQEQSDGSHGVFGSHDYAEPGRYDISIRLVGTDDSVGWDYHMAWAYADSMMIFDAGALYLSPQQSAEASSQVVLGTLVDLDTRGEPDYAVSIDWGDGTVSDGRVDSESATMQVLGQHRYAAQGIYQVSFTVAKSGQSGGSISALSTAYVNVFASDAIDKDLESLADDLVT